MSPFVLVLLSNLGAVAIDMPHSRYARPRYDSGRRTPAASGSASASTGGSSPRAGADDRPSLRSAPDPSRQAMIGPTAGGMTGIGPVKLVP